MSELADYKITFRQNPLLGTWTYSGTAPDGVPLLCFGVFVTKIQAEEAALRAIRNHTHKETVDGDELLRRVEARAE